MNHKGFAKIVLIVTAIIVVGVVGYFILNQQTSSSTPTSSLTPTPITTQTPTSTPKQITLPISDKSNKSGVIISTDKTKYDKGEIIKIVVNNKLDTSILYYSGGGKFWGIEYFKDDKWINPAYESGGGFQLTEKNLGDSCYIALYERESPSEFKPQTNLSSQWNQKICPLGTASPAEPRIVKYIGGGQYRLTFTYGFEISSDDPYKLSGFKTVYSNSFTIK